MKNFSLKKFSSKRVLLSILQTMVVVAIVAVVFSSSRILYAQPVANTPPPAPVSNNGVVITDDDGRLEPSVNPKSSAFKIQVCDGPRLPDKLMKELPPGTTYIPCDFNAVMLLVQHLINIMLVVGVLVAIVMFTYAGWLLISGTQDHIKLAKSIFPKVFIGFIIMLSAWFVVYQILSWLTDNEGFKTLLGS